MSIPDIALQLFCHAMEISTDHYTLVQNMHLQFLKAAGEVNEDEDKIDEKSYWLRSRDSKKRKFVQRYIEQQDKQTEEVALVSELFNAVRHKIRFEYRRDYIYTFVVNYVHSFQDLLQFGRFVLENARQNKHKWIDSPTSIEESLYCQGDWPIKQMIDLNHYMYTHASTNFPCELFQEMFLYGYLPKRVATRIKPLLEKQGLQVTIKPIQHPEPYGIFEKPWIKDLIDVEIFDPVLTNRDLYLKVFATLNE